MLDFKEARICIWEGFDLTRLLYDLIQRIKLSVRSFENILK